MNTWERKSTHKNTNIHLPKENSKRHSPTNKYRTTHSQAIYTNLSSKNILNALKIIQNV